MYTKIINALHLAQIMDSKILNPYDYQQFTTIKCLFLWTHDC